MAKREAVGVRGEHGREFSLEAVKAAVRGEVVFCATSAQKLVVMLRGAKKVKGEVVEEPIDVEFSDFTLRLPADDERVEMIRASKAYKRGVIVELSKIREGIREKTIAAQAAAVKSDPELAKALVADPEVAKALAAALRQGKGAAPDVKA